MRGPQSRTRRIPGLRYLSNGAVGANGNRAKRSPELEGVAASGPAASGAVLATVATVIQMALVLLITNVATCRAVAMPLLFS